jgi:hypothetical protein
MEAKFRSGDIVHGEHLKPYRDGEKYSRTGVIEAVWQPHDSAGLKPMPWEWYNAYRIDGIWFAESEIVEVPKS